MVILLRIIKTLLYIFAFSAVSFTVVYLLNKSNLDLAQREIKNITPDNYKQIEPTIMLGSVIEITGTPDLLKQVSQEQEDSTTNTVQSYYVGLKEYGDDFIVKINPGQLTADKQTFEGQVNKLSQIPSGEAIKTNLNNPVDFNSNANSDFSKGLDQDSQNLIIDDSKANFTDSSFVVLNNAILDPRQVILGISLWTCVLSLFLITIFRKKVFLMR